MMKIVTEWIVALAALGALGVSIFNMFKIKEVHLLINSRLTQLLELTQKSSKAEGVKEGREQQIPH